MKTTTYNVTVNETRETKTFETKEAAKQWALDCKKTLGMWGGEVTFTLQTVTTTETAFQLE